MKKILLALLALALLTSCTTRSRNFEDGDRIDIHVGEIVTVELPENPTTGYSWDYSFSEDSTVIVVEDKFVQSESKGMVGVGGVHRYSIKGVDDGDTLITFRYHRPWEKDVEPVETRTLTLHVTHKRLNISIGLQASHSF